MLFVYTISLECIWMFVKVKGQTLFYWWVYRKLSTASWLKPTCSWSRNVFTQWPGQKRTFRSFGYSNLKAFKACRSRFSEKPFLQITLSVTEVDFLFWWLLLLYCLLWFFFCFHYFHYLPSKFRFWIGTESGPWIRATKVWRLNKWPENGRPLLLERKIHFSSIRLF